MVIYAAFLRGVNIGGKNKIKMAELKSMLEGIGLHHVHTYLQSGNVLFGSEEAAEPLCWRIEQEIGNAFGVLFRQSVLDSKLASNIQKLGDKVTTRNWNTIDKLCRMGKAK